MPEPKVSVIIPHRNCNELLPNALASVAMQSVDVEVIIVDNASTVAPEVLGTRLIRHDRDEGIPRSLNDGYCAATTPYCCLLGADDTFEEMWLKTALDMFHWNPQISFVCPNTTTQLAWPSILDNNYMHMGAVFRRSIVLEMGGYAHVPFHDWDLWVRLAKAGVTGISITNNFYNWNREHYGSHNDGEQRYAEHVALLRKRWEELP